MKCYLINLTFVLLFISNNSIATEVADSLKTSILTNPSDRNSTLKIVAKAAPVIATSTTITRTVVNSNIVYNKDATLSGYTEATGDTINVYKVDVAHGNGLSYTGTTISNIQKDGKWYWTLTGLDFRENDVFIAMATDSMNNTSQRSAPYTIRCLVSNNNSDGPGSYLQAVLGCAELAADYSEVQFNIPGSGPHEINLQTAWYTYYPLFVNGTSQPGYDTIAKVPQIILQGSRQLNIPWFLSLRESSGGSKIQGLHIRNFLEQGIVSLASNQKIIDNVFSDIYPSGINDGSYYILFAGAGAGSEIYGNIFGTDNTGQNLTTAPGYHSAIYFWSQPVWTNDIQNIKIGGPKAGQANLFRYVDAGVILYKTSDQTINKISKVTISQNIFKDIKDSKIYLEAGTNYDTPAPLLDKGKYGQLSGLATIKNSKVEVYKSDSTGKDASVYLGTAIANQPDNTVWRWTLNNPLISVGGDYEASSTDTLGNTSEFSDPFYIALQQLKIFVDTKGADSVRFTVSGSGLSQDSVYYAGHSGSLKNGVITLYPTPAGAGQTTNVKINFSRTKKNSALNISFDLNSLLKISNVKISKDANTYASMNPLFYSIDTTNADGQTLRLITKTNKAIQPAYSTNLHDGLLFLNPGSNNFTVTVTEPSLTFKSLRIYNYKDELVQNLSLPMWNGADALNNAVSDGIYKYQIEATNQGASTIFKGQFIVKK